MVVLACCIFRVVLFYCYCFDVVVSIGSCFVDFVVRLMCI